MPDKREFRLRDHPHTILRLFGPLFAIAFAVLLADIIVILLAR